ncbi:MAG: hypothetical protein ACI9BW_000179 [Gammaproteobacteria bacterium]|jgi:hypothetical protein
MVQLWTNLFDSYIFCFVFDNRRLLAMSTAIQFSAPSSGLAITLANGLSLAWAACFWCGAPAVIAGSACLILVMATLWDSRLSLWLGCALVLHVHVGIGLEFYKTASWFDLLLHGATTGWIVSLSWERLKLAGLGNLAIPVWLPFIILALGFGAAWELFEASLDALFELGAQPDLLDTNLDLVADLIGGLLACLVVTARRSRIGHSSGLMQYRAGTPANEIS